MSDSPFQWNSTTLIKRVEDWVLNIEDFPYFLSMLRELDDEGLSWAEYRELLDPNVSRAWRNKTEPIVNRIRELLFNDTGITVLRCGPTLTGNQARLVELLVGCGLGKNVTMTPVNREERPLFKATISKNSTIDGRYAGNALKGNAIGLHTDGSGTIDRKIEVLSMLYIRPARFGGQSVVANSQLAFKSLKLETKKILQRSFPRENPYKGDSPPSELLCIPIFRMVRNGTFKQMEFSYHPSRIRNGVKLARSGKKMLEKFKYQPDKMPNKLTKEENSALREVEKALVDNSCEITLSANDILLLNNLIVTHDRRPFYDDPKAPRLMERFWAGRFRNADGGRHPVGVAYCDSCAS